MALDAVGLETIPDFNLTYLDDRITFAPKKRPQQDRQEASPTSTSAQASHTNEADSEIDRGGLPDALVTPAPVDPTYRIGRLDMAHGALESVPPDALIDRAVYIMLKNDFSQLPVMTSERDVKGLFSWKSFGSRCSLGCHPSYVRDAMDPACEVGVDESLFNVVALIKQHDRVLVRESDRRISGIITGYDISKTFGELGEPFLLLGEIENHIRMLIAPKFSSQELASARDPQDPNRQINAVSDLTLGEYLHLLENPDRWGRLALHVDRATFVKDFGEICDLRNEIMHFNPEGIDEKQLAMLRQFVEFLRRLQKLGPKQ